MRATKQRISILKSKVNDVLPDGQDIFGFSGISKPMIIETLDDAYNIVSTLDSYEKKFEAILLERKSSEYFDRASKLLKENFEHKRDEFNEFLNVISKFHFRIKEAYISLVKEPIRVESQIEKAREELLALEEKITEIRPFYEEILEMKSNVESFASDLKEKHTDAINKSETIKTELEEIDSLKEDAETASSQISTWEKNIKELKEEIAIKVVTFEELKTKIELLKDDTAKTFESNVGVASRYENQVKQNSKFQEEIQKTIEDANRHGMAGSFKKRKDELKWSLVLWGGATLVSIGLLIFLSSRLLIEFKKEDFEMSRVLARLPIFASCVWLGWFCAKQYGFTSRIMEDYAYKYAVSMAFEGYKNSTKDIDPKLQLQLLEMTIMNISRNPLSIYETGSNHGTPIHELLNDIPRKFSVRKKIGNVEAEIKVDENKV